jgi:hypothetical protein
VYSPTGGASLENVRGFGVGAHVRIELAREALGKEASGGGVHAVVTQVGVRARLRFVAVQVAFETQTLKPVFRLIGYRLWV